MAGIAATALSTLRSPTYPPHPQTGGPGCRCPTCHPGYLTDGARGCWRLVREPKRVNKAKAKAGATSTTPHRSLSLSPSLALPLVVAQSLPHCSGSSSTREGAARAFSNPRAAIVCQLLVAKI
ncbi:hypothetical protein ZWY2020_014096 [Hordeum vulgare]|nr:hypothetical protein ZWY2020_014096 [Hordeum vulgare]